MDWDGYTVFSVITGIACILLGAFANKVSNKSRMWAVLGGIVFAGYGIYVAAQDSGTYYFSIFIFVLPFALAAKIIYDMVQKKKSPAMTQDSQIQD
jgi:hypothetical protein